MTSTPEPLTDSTQASEEMLDDEVHRALRERALLFDRSARGRVRLTGPKAPELLTGMVTNDVGSLAPGGGVYACALSPKGRIVADLRVYAEADSLLIDVPERAMPGWMAMVRKFINPRLAPYKDVSPESVHLAVYGPAAPGLIAMTCGLDESSLCALSPYAHVRGTGDASDAVVARSPELRVDGFDLFASGSVAESIRQRLLDAGAGMGSPQAWTVARVEAGRPEWGVDMDDSTLPQEANMDELGAISYTKGCYVGQEVVARIHFRGHVNRRLCGLRFGNPDGAPHGTELRDAGGKSVGDVRSSVRSPTLGAIALAMVRREVGMGGEVIALTARGDVPAAVSALPFGP